MFETFILISVVQGRVPHWNTKLFSQICVFKALLLDEITQGKSIKYKQLSFGAFQQEDMTPVTERIKMFMIEDVNIKWSGQSEVVKSNITHSTS